MARSVAARAVFGLGALGVVVGGCNGSSDPRVSVPSEMSSGAPRGAQVSEPPSGAPSDAAELPVAEAVAEVHRKAFAADPADAELGQVVCVITLHDAALGRGEFFPVTLFASGFVVTWTQTPAGIEEPFRAQLTDEERLHASQLIEAIPAGRALSRDAFDASALVMGVSVRVGQQVQTSFFDLNRIPEALDQLAALLKQRLETTNRTP